MRKKEHNGLNKKSGNLNSTLREIWPEGSRVDDRDIMVVSPPWNIGGVMRSRLGSGMGECIAGGDCN